MDLKAIKDVVMTKVLAVDDDRGVLQIISQLLRLEGHKVLTANDGLEALEVLSGEKVGLMILDLQMPNLDGRETFLAARRSGYDGPVLILSSFGARTAAKELGAEGALEKPFDPENLCAAVETLGAFDMRHAPPPVEN